METKVDAAMVFGLGDLKLDPMANVSHQLEENLGGLHGLPRLLWLLKLESWRSLAIKCRCGELRQPDKCTLSSSIYLIFDS